MFWKRTKKGVVMQKGHGIRRGSVSTIFTILVLVAGALTRQMMNNPSGRTSSISRYSTRQGAAVVEDGISVYFSPKGGCQAAVINQIESARQSVDMQAYSFTSNEIERALELAQGRGVKVRVIIDKNESEDRSSMAPRLAQDGVQTFIDGDHPIAHNKVVIIDNQTVVTGSFNFTHQAENANAENLLVITGHPEIAAAYEQNFQEHLSHSPAM
jgi:phosphatidylserine/phosphatidylglycerophosphate/cardiolipin synthase-like enzyme